MTEDKKVKNKEAHHICIEKIKSLQVNCRDLNRKMDSIDSDYTDFRLHISDMIEYLKDRSMKLEAKLSSLESPRQSFVQKIKNFFN